MRRATAPVKRDFGAIHS